MAVFLIFVHVIVCLALIGIVLIQGSSKGAEMGASFGGGSSQTVFGASGGQTLVHKLTTGAAIIFMLTSLTLAYFHNTPGASSVMPESVAPATQQQAAPQPATEK